MIDNKLSELERELNKLRNQKSDLASELNNNKDYERENEILADKIKS